MSFAVSDEREHTTAYHIRNVVFFMAVIAMNYTLARPSPVDLLFVTAAALSVFGPLRPRPAARPWSDAASNLLQALHWASPR